MFSIYFNVGIRDAAIVKFWADTDMIFKIAIWPIADVYLLFIPLFVPGKLTLTPHARTHSDMHPRTSYTRTHNDTGRGFYDLYEIILFISTTAPTFNIKIISMWA